MFKELMPQNEELGTILDTLFISLGWLTSIAGGIAGLITFRWKTKYQAKIQTEMQAKADELSQTLNEKITRRSKAFDLRIQKQYEFYERFGIMLQSLIEQSNSAYIMIDLIMNTNIVFRGKDEQVYIDNENNNKAQNVRIIKPDIKKYFDLVNSLESLITSYSFYLDSDTYNVCKVCNIYLKKFSQISYRCINIIEAENEIDDEANNLQEYFDKVIESLNEVGQAIKQRIDDDSKH